MQRFPYALAFFLIATLGYCVNIPPFPFFASDYERSFSSINDEDLLIAREQAREMFYFGYQNYMNYAFPFDELDPVHCRGRGHDYKNVNNFNINDVLGDFSLTLIDSLNTLVILGDREEFHKAIQLVLDNVTFDRNVTVQVFETTIRVIGSLLSSHLILTNDNPFHGDFSLPNYDGDLLTMAHDLATRLLPAFEGTRTGIPYTRVNLQHGVSSGTVNETCTAGAGSLVLEFGVLSRLLGNETFENIARRVTSILWNLRHSDTGLLGNVINIQTGIWSGVLSGLGAGIDSYFEYLLKAHILFGESAELEMFVEALRNIHQHLRRGRSKCRSGFGELPFYANTDMRDGTILNTWVDALQASFPGVLTLAGDVDEAVCLHAFYYAVWQKYDMLPERYNWHSKMPDASFYPLRPEFVESTYLLYLATKNPFYQHVGMQIIDSLNLHTRVACGFSTVHNVLDKSLEDRMESFFLSETCKYLYLLFDRNNPVNLNYHRLLFTTEGHTLPIISIFRQKTAESRFEEANNEKYADNFLILNRIPNGNANFRSDCLRNDLNASHLRPPLDEWRFGQYMAMVGLNKP